MLLQNLVSSSVEAALPFPSNCVKQDVLCDWMICSQQPEPSNSNAASTSISDPNRSSKRRKLHDNSLLILPLNPHNQDQSYNHTSTTDSLNTDIDHSLQFCNKGISIPITIDDQSTDFRSLYPISDKYNSYSSSLNVDKRVVSTSTRNEVKYAKEFQASELVVLDKDLPARDICVSVLKRHGLLVAHWPMSITSPQPQIVGNSDDNITSQYCELCGVLDSTLNMLLCDNCEGAFHLSCCNTKRKMLPVDEWFCQNCSKLDSKVSLEASFLKSRKLSCWNGLSKFKSSPIASMLKHPEPYTSRVRIGNSFQAVVPLWSGQVSEDCDCIGEPLEMNPAETIGLHGSSTNKLLRPATINNWLQCQEVLYDGSGESGEGFICGKWRRAPLSEVQTDQWDCSCSVLWDASHSDCAVPQELETGEVLRQLKYIDQLRSRLAAKKSVNL